MDIIVTFIGNLGENGIACLTDLWEKSMDSHPYIFYMGTDFRKLKAPFIWYDIMHVAESLSLWPKARSDPRFMDMWSQIARKSSPQRLYTPDAAWRYWKEWDFGQTKAPSSWLSFLVERIRRRIELG